MPTYSYSCNECGHAFDMRQTMADAPLRTCPECAGRLRKLLTAPFVVTPSTFGSRSPGPRNGCMPGGGGGCCG
jgi:putative FmdB family regulatory protein